MSQTNQAKQTGIKQFDWFRKRRESTLLLAGLAKAPSKETDCERLFFSMSLASQLSDRTIDEGIALHVHTDIAGMRTI